MNKGRCLILGGCGFIGSHVADLLCEQLYPVRIFDKLNVRKDRVSHLAGRIEIIEGDFANEDNIYKALEDVETVFHFISTTVPQTSQSNPVFDLESNVVSTLRLLDMCVEKKIRKLIFASSAGTVYGITDEAPVSEGHPNNPICAYGVSKLVIEKYLYLYHYHHDLDYTVLRFSNPYGERQSPEAVQGAVAVFLGRIKKGEPITIWGDGTVERDFLYIKDLAEACLKALRMSCDDRTFNIAYGKTISINELMRTIEKVIGKTVKVNYVEGRHLDLKKMALDITAARERLGWTPTTSLEEGIKRTWKWIMQSYD